MKGIPSASLPNLGHPKIHLLHRKSMSIHLRLFRNIPFIPRFELKPRALCSPCLLPELRPEGVWPRPPGSSSSNNEASPAAHHGPWGMELGKDAADERYHKTLAAY